MSKYKQGRSAIHQRIRKAMRGKRVWKPWQLQTKLNLQGGYRRLSESTLTRELRRMLDVKVVPCANDSWDYSLIKECKV